MSEPVANSLIPEQPPVERRTGTFWPALVWSVYASLAIALVAFVVYCSQLRQDLRIRLTDLTAKHSQLQDLHERLTVAREQSGRDKNTITGLMEVLRGPEEIPGFGGDRIIFSNRNFDSLRFYVPEGNHVLQIKTRWIQGTSSFTSPKPVEEDSSQDVVLGEETWEIPLLSNSGYFLELDAVWLGPLLNWKLAGSHPDFELQRGALPLQHYKLQAWMQGTREGVKFPNEVLSAYLLAQQYTEEYATGLNLMSSKILGRLADDPSAKEPIEISIEVDLHSDTPPSVPASGVEMLYWNKPQLLAPYTGQGKYDLIVPN